MNSRERRKPIQHTPRCTADAVEERRSSANKAIRFRSCAGGSFGEGRCVQHQQCRVPLFGRRRPSLRVERKFQAEYSDHGGEV